MAACESTQPSDALSTSELRAFQVHLTALARTVSRYPLECAIGPYELLFESRDDIEDIVANLGETLSESHRFA
jgi:hypothetical protein